MGKSKFTVSLDTDGITKQVADAAFKSVLYQVADQILGELTKKNAFFDDQTGEMRRSFKMSKMRYGTGYIIYSDNPHAWHLEKGHAIVKDGRVVKQVLGKFFIRKAKNRVKRRLNELIKTFDLSLSREHGLHIGKGK